MNSRHSRRHSHGEEGQVVVWFVAMSVITLAIIAFGVDLGFLFNARRVAQNAADAGATAGAGELPGCGDGLATVDGVTYDDPATTPLLLSERFSGKNLDPTEGKAYSVTAGDLYEDASSPYHASYGSHDTGDSTFTTVYQRVKRQQGMIFARFLGIGSKLVPAEAEAVCGPIKTGGVCPFYIKAPLPNEPPVYVDPSTGAEVPAGTPGARLKSAYGLIGGVVYPIKTPQGDGASSGNTGMLDLFPEIGQGNGTSWQANFIASGCEDPQVPDTPVIISEDEEVGTSPKYAGNPIRAAFEGKKQGNENCGGPAAGFLNYIGLYEDECRKTLGYFTNGHSDCNLEFQLDSDQTYPWKGYVLDDAGNQMDPLDVAALIDDMTDPAKMAAAGNTAPCGGYTATGQALDGETGEIDLFHPSTQGRFMQIVMTDDSPSGASNDVNVKGIIRMYLLCWTDQSLNSGEQICDPLQGNGAGDMYIYGVFSEFSAPNNLPGSGLGDNVFAPKHVVLVK